MTGEPCCKMLADNLSGQNGQAAGIHAYVATNVKTGKERLVGFYLRRERKRKARDTGVMLRWCPFCCADLEEKYRP